MYETTLYNYDEGNPQNDQEESIVGCVRGLELLYNVGNDCSLEFQMELVIVGEKIKAEHSCSLLFRLLCCLKENMRK